MLGRTWIGIALTISSGFCLALSIICGKVTTSVNPFLFLMIRNSFTFTLVLPIIITNRTSFFGHRGERRSLFFNAIFFAVTSLLAFVSIRYMPTGDATAIFSNYPVLAIFISKIFYKTKISVVEMSCALASLIGVVFVAKPRFLFGHIVSSDDGTYWIGAVAASCCLLSYAIGATATQGLKTTPITIPVLHNSVYTVLLSFIVHVTVVSFEFGMVSCGWQPFFIFGSSLLFASSLSFFQLAVKFERITTLLPVRTSEVLIAYVLQVVILGVYPTWNSYVGATIIITSVLTISARRVLRERKKAKIMEESDSTV